MEIKGFNLLLQDFCENCVEFEPDVEKVDISAPTYARNHKYVNNIRCEHRKRCAVVAENLRGKMSSVENIIRFFEEEISKCTEARREMYSYCFNNITFCGKTYETLNEAHVRYCQDIIDRIKEGSL